jgi:hypothetical protein
MAMTDEPKTFKIGGGALRMIQVLAVAGLAMAIGFTYATATGKTSGWGFVAALWGGAVLMGLISYLAPGVLSIDDDGIAVQRRSRQQRLAWTEVKTVGWNGHGGLAGLAADNWVATIKGEANGKKITIVLSGPMLERQAEARALLAARFPTK